MGEGNFVCCLEEKGEGYKGFEDVIKVEGKRREKDPLAKVK